MTATSSSAERTPPVRGLTRSPARQRGFGSIDFTPLIYFGIAIGIVIVLVLGALGWLGWWLLQHLAWVVS